MSVGTKTMTVIFFGALEKSGNLDEKHADYCQNGLILSCL
jgi:hypothetical protein